jgi:LPS export ABC transporter permease LptG
MYRYRKPWRLFFSILKETLPFIIISFLILTTLVFVQQVGKYSNIILSFQSSARVTAGFLISLIPGIVIITLPVSLLLGTVITCSRLSSDSELVAAQSSGVSKLSLAFPFIFCGLLGTGLTFYLSCEIAPRSLKQLKSLMAKILLEEASTQIRPHAFITTFPNVLMYVQDIDRATGDWLGVFIMQVDQERGVSRLLSSERGQLRLTSAPRVVLEAQLSRGLSLENRFKPQSQAPLTGSQAASVFEKGTIILTEKGAEEDEANDAPGAIKEMTIGEVTRYIKSAPTPKDRLRAVVEWHKRIAFSLACLTLTCVAYIVALRGRRFSTRPRTVVAILFIAMAFYLLLVSGQNLSLSGSLPAWLGVWLSNILLGVYIVKSFATTRQLLSSESLLQLLPARVKKMPPPGSTEKVEERSRRDQAAQPSVWGAVPSRFSLINLINYLIVSEITKYYLLALTALVVTSIIFTLFDLIPAMAKSGTSIGYAASYLAYLAPQLAYFVSPFALLVAILTGCSVLGRSNQLVILYGAGQGKGRVVTAIMMTALPLGIGLWLFSDYLLPYANREQDIRYHKIKSKQMEQTTLAFGKKWVYGKNNIIYSYQRIDQEGHGGHEDGNSLLNTSMYHLSPSNGVLERATYFSKATQLSPASWEAADGWTEIINPGLTIERVPLKSADRLITIEDGSMLFKRTVNESSKMGSGDLRDYIRQLKDVGIATTELQLDLRKRASFPFSCLTLALLAVPFATTRRARRAGPLLSVAIGVGISLVFWLLMTLFEAAGKQASLPVALAVWGPQILFLALGMYLNFKHRSH